MELEKLRGQEIQIFKRMLEKYRGYDFIDILIHKTLKCVGTSKEEFVNREVVKKKRDTSEATINSPTEEIRFCDGDKCENPMMKKGC